MPQAMRSEGPGIPLVESTVRSGEVEIFVARSRDVGEDAGRPTLVFVHGYPDTHATWSHQLEGLAPSHPVAAFDLRGAGRSSAPRSTAGYRVDAVLADFDAVLDAVAGPAGRVHLIGHDWGAALGWCYAADSRRATRLRSFTAIAGPHPALMGARLREALARHRVADLAFVAEQLRRSWYMMAFQIPGLGEALWRRWPEALWRRSLRAGGVPADDPALALDRAGILAGALGPIGLYRANFGGLARPAEVPTIEVPVSLVVPARDFALAPELYDNAAEHVRDFEVRYLEGGHWIHRRMPEVVTGIVRDFVARH